MLPKDLLVHLERHDGKRMREVLEKPIHDNQLSIQTWQYQQYLQLANMQNQFNQGQPGQAIGGLGKGLGQVYIPSTNF